jgi:hypothetical protein
LKELELSIGLLAARPHFGNLQNLVSLALTFSPMGFQPGKLLPSGFENCENLKVLRIKDNSGCPYRWVTSVLQKSCLCPKLEVLELIDWQPDDYFNESWPNLKEIKYSATIPSRDRLHNTYFMAQKAPQLTSIEMKNCVIQASIFDCFIKLSPKLSKIDCEDCSIEYDRWVSPQPQAGISLNLVSANTQMNFNSSSVPSSPRETTNSFLEISLKGCNITAELLSSFVNVNRLNLAYTNANDEILASCGEVLQSLQVLDLTGCKGVKQTKLHFMKQLSILKLTSTKITKESLIFSLEQNPQLKQVYIDNTDLALKSRTLKTLQHDFPSMEIITNTTSTGNRGEDTSVSSPLATSFS